MIVRTQLPKGPRIVPVVIVPVVIVLASLLSGCAGSGAQVPPSTLAPLETMAGPPAAPDAPASPALSLGSASPSLPVISIDPVPLSGLVLSADGLGEARFGDEAEVTVAYVSGLLGSPTGDTGWVDIQTEMLICERSKFRLLEWGVLRLEFGSLSVSGGDERHFLGWDYGTDGRLGEDPEGLITAFGVGLGARVDELLAAYPTSELFEGEEGNFPPAFTQIGGISGFTTGTTDSDVITVMQAGERCG